MSTPRQIVSFGVIGIVSNGVLYVLYLALTSLGVGHKIGLTLVFATGVLCTYALNRRWTFRHNERIGSSAGRYIGAYFVGYLANVGSLILLVDVLKLPHRAVVLGLIVATAGLMFVLQKFWVFPHHTGVPRTIADRG